jgi:hypothetical protein
MLGTKEDPPRDPFVHHREDAFRTVAIASQDAAFLVPLFARLLRS